MFGQGAVFSAGMLWRWFCTGLKRKSIFQFVKLASLGIMGVQLTALFKPLNTIVFCDVRGAVNWVPNDALETRVSRIATRLIGVVFAIRAVHKLYRNVPGKYSLPRS